MDDLRSTSARIFYVRSICRMHHLSALFRASWLFVRPSGGVCCCLPLALRSCAVGVRLCPPGLPGFVRPSGGVRLLGGSLVAFVSSVGWRFGSGRGSALFSSPTGNKIGVLYNRGPFPDYKPQRGTKRRFCLKQGFAFLGLVAVGLVFRVAVAGRRAVAAFLAFVWLVGLGFSLVFSCR